MQPCRVQNPVADLRWQTKIVELVGELCWYHWVKCCAIFNKQYLNIAVHILQVSVYSCADATLCGSVWSVCKLERIRHDCLDVTHNNSLEALHYY